MSASSMRPRLLLAPLLALAAACGEGALNTSGEATRGPATLGDAAAIQTRVCADLAPLMAGGEGLGASLAVLRDGELIWAGGCGNIGGDPDDPVGAVRATGWPAGGLTVWPVSSVSKLVMAIAVLQVVEQLADAAADGAPAAWRTRFDALLDRDVNELVRLADDDVLRVRHRQHPTRPITLRMLLTHTSGVTDDYALTPHAVEVHRPDYTDRAPLELREALRRHFDSGAGFLPHAPGGGYSYSSTASSISALLVRPQTGSSFEAHTRRRVFDPLQMDDTRWRLAALRDPARTEQGHYRLDEERVLGLPVEAVGTGASRTFRRPAECVGIFGSYRCTFWEHTFYPAASLRTTVVDFAAFVGALMSRGRHGAMPLLRPETLVEMTDGEQLGRFGLDPADHSYQGLIAYWEKVGETWLACHSGRNPGYTSNVCFQPAEHRTREGVLTVPAGPRHGVIVLSNMDGAEDFVGQATSYLLAQTAPGGVLAP